MLTDASARTIMPGSKPLAAGGVAGLFLFPSATRGRGKWILRFVSPMSGKRRDMGLGTYPELGIASARKAALEAREIIRSGADPIEVRRTRQLGAAARQRTPTFRNAATAVHAEVSPSFKNAKHRDQWLTSLETFAFPMIGNRAVSELKASDFADVLRPIWLTKPETASRVRQRCDTVMKWCAAHDFIVASPVGVVDALLPRQPAKRERIAHYPAVPWRQMPKLFQTLFRAHPSSFNRLALELLVLTAARSGEVRGMSWQEVDLQKAIWTIPASRMKAKLMHRIPLSSRAMEILRIQSEFSGSSDLVFVSGRNTLMSDTYLTKPLRVAMVPSDAPGRCATAHGFRSTFRDWASEMGYSRDLAERALAHTVRNETEAAYHRTDLLEARRPMMDRWASFLNDE